MLPKKVLPPNYLVEHFLSTVRHGRSIEGHLLTQGEDHILRTFLALDHPVQHVYARLHGRLRQPVREDTFKPPGVEDIPGVLTQLESLGFIDRGHLVPKRQRHAAMRVPELRALCKREALPTKGRRPELLARIQQLETTGGPSVIRLRHSSLFRRLLRAGLQDHRGDLTKSVLHDLGVSRSADYTPTAGAGRFPKRHGMRAYEWALKRYQAGPEQPPRIEKTETLLRELSLSSTVPDYRFRFSAKRFLGDLLRLELRNLERHQDPQTLVDLYEQAVCVHPEQASYYRHRLALVEDKRGNCQIAATLCARHTTDDAFSFTVHRTGRRIAKKCRITYPADLKKEPATEQHLTLPWQREKGAWKHPQLGPLRIEKAVIEWLRGHDREAVYAEGRFWSTLFALVYASALFAPIPGMLPCPHLNKPLDFGTVAFRTRRQAEIETIQHQVRTNGLSHLIQKTWRQRHGQNITGLSWVRWPLEALCAAVEAIDPHTVLRVLDHFIDRGKRATKGLPDLLILPGPSVSENIQLGTKAMLVEIKGPGDSLRDAQRWWLRRLKELGIDPEIWRVRPGNTN